jgi:hypothetical protein
MKKKDKEYFEYWRQLFINVSNNKHNAFQQAEAPANKETLRSEQWRFNNFLVRSNLIGNGTTVLHMRRCSSLKCGLI